VMIRIVVEIGLLCRLVGSLTRRWEKRRGREREWVGGDCDCDCGGE